METRNESRKEYVVLEPKVKRKAQEGYYERRSYSRPWEKIECKKPAKREVTSEVTKAQNSRLAEASKRAKEELADAEKRAEWEAKYRTAHRNWTKHGKPIKTLWQYVVGEMMNVKHG